jgi:hypothetical protein
MHRCTSPALCWAPAIATSASKAYRASRSRSVEHRGAKRLARTARPRASTRARHAMPAPARLALSLERIGGCQPFVRSDSPTKARRRCESRKIFVFHKESASSSDARGHRSSSYPRRNPLRLRHPPRRSPHRCQRRIPRLPRLPRRRTCCPASALRAARRRLRGDERRSVFAPAGRRLRVGRSSRRRVIRRLRERRRRGRSRVRN